MATPSRQGARRAEGLSLLRALVANLSSSARAVERQTGITNAQLFLLQELASSGPHSLGDLAEMARTQPSTVSIVIGRLQKAGYVTRKPATDDRRRVVIALTAAGTRLVVRAPVAPTARLFGAVEALDEVELRSLVRGLKPLLRHLGDARIGEPPMLFEYPPRRSARRSAPPSSGKESK